ncbi:hypothetical protein [Chryseobacterium salivictor]|uniref:Uncharacterized protein n=1 Tax=Chryseobacterium salivictor TaxID=2547600 RepID=A0A4P6ZIC2_9FLAO|nr:hypothetical protein [Chryseobacterium salivictor]QBO59616.1 hypothetical protein NBC122_02815 [Chryseobacterium salivictor]
MENKEFKKNELQDFIIQEGDELRKSLIDKLFNLNTLLSATFLVLFQLDIKSFNVIKILNILPFCTVILILLYQLYGLRILGSAYYKLEKWKKGDMNSLKKMNENNLYIILIAIILTLIEIGYLFFIFLN